VDAQGESADGPAVASAPAEMPVADMLALVASFLPEKAASVVKDTPAAEAIAVRAARAADLAPVAPRAAQATDVVDTITPAFDAALADSAAAAADASAAAVLPAAPETAAAPAPVTEVDQSALLAMAQARPEAARGRGVTEAQAPKAAPVAANAAASEGIAGFDGIPTARSEAALPVARSAPEAPLAEQPVPETRTPSVGAAQQQPVRTQAEPVIAARPAAPAVADNAVREVAAAPVSAPVQQASLNIAQAAAGVHTDKIAARVGTPGWDNQVSQKIVWMVAGKEQSATLTLNPPDLGPMQVVLSVNNDQATVTFSSAQPEVRAALENAMPRLREMLDESGVALSNASVNAGMPDQRQAQGDQRAGNNGNHGNGPARFETNGSASEAAARSAARPATGGNGLVDTFA
jgi:flagellar hook-length control protein FliK